MRAITLFLSLSLLLACGPGAEVSSGRDLYLAYGCAACHGTAGDGRGPSAALASVKPRDLSNPAGFRGARTTEGIATTIAFGIADGRTGMPAYPDIPKRERMAMARYIESLATGRRGVIASEAWAAPSNPAWKIAAAYVELTNATDRPVALVKVSSPAASVVEMHDMTVRDGMMSMRRLERLDLAPGATIRLAPGGTHLMLVDLVRDLRSGDEVPLTLTFDDGTVRAVTALVREDLSAAPPPTTEATAPQERAGSTNDFTLVDHDGRTFRSSSLRGTPALLFFGYTHCPDACPTILSRLSRAYRLAGPDARRIPTLFVSVDPRDTPPVLKQYLSYFAAVPARGLTGSKAQIDAVVRQLGAKVEIREDGVVDHTLWLYVLDRNGAIAHRFGPDAEPSAVAKVMKEL